MRSKSVRFVLLIVTVLVLSCSFVSYRLLSGGERAADIRLDIESVDFGQVAPGSEHPATFRFRNPGTKKLFIWEADPSCGCAKPELSARELEGGREGVINVNFRAPAELGPVHHTIRLSTNARRGNPTTLHLRAFVGTGILAFPSQAKISGVRRNRTKTAKLELYASEHRPFTIKTARFEGGSDAVNVNIETELNTAKISHQVGLQVSADGEPGVRRGQVVLETTCAEAPTVSVPVEVEVVARVAASPSTLMLGSRKGGAQISATVGFSCDDSLVAVR